MLRPLANVPRSPALLTALLAWQLATPLLATAAGVVSLATSPLTISSSSSVKPNLLFTLDNSGSMSQDYTPDSVTSNNCYTSSGGYTGCVKGDPPYMSSDFNTQYYNPALTYPPGVNADGTSKTAQNSGNTASWTTVRSDSYGGTGTFNLASNYPDRSWCTTSALTTCVKNSGYSYPDFAYSFANSITGAPYYYTIGVGEYCSDANLSTCITSTTASGSYVYPAKVRWCNSSALTTCQAKRLGSYTYPRYSTTNLTGTNAQGSITIGDSGSTASVSLADLKINGVSIINSTITAGSGTNNSSNRNSVASVLSSAINSYTSSPDYTATVAGNVVTIKASTPGVGSNGYALVVTAPASSPVSATATLTVSSTTSGSTITQVTANGTNLFCPGYTTATAGSSSSSSTRKNTLASVIASNIHNCKGTTGYDASASSAVVTITAPASLGAGLNSQSPSTTTGTGTIGITAGTFSGGVNATSIPTTLVNMNGGGNASSTFSRVDIVPTTTSYNKAGGRTDCAGSTCTYDEEMTNFANWYSFYRTRIQMMKSAAGRAFTSIGSNFRVGFVTINSPSSHYLKIADFDTTQKSSWYTMFYGISPGSGTPLRSALVRAGRIFAGKNPMSVSGGDDPLQYSCQQNFVLLTTDGYWNTDSESAVVKIDGTSQINNQDNDSSTMPRPMFDGNGSALSCPAGATCLGAGGPGSVSGSSYSSVNTLADVAAYYYNTDLRTTALGNCTSPSTGADVCANNVPGSGNDTNSQQHMTTFTLGLADGSLTYQSDYASANSGDYYQILQGTKDWPQVLHDDPTAIDDLWHAAVNGRGQFFFAQDPNALSTGLNSALSGVSARLGSGAAAATSNLEPVQGDNFAYVASYTTVKWYGNLESRTVDTQTGVVSPSAVWCVEDVVADPSTGAIACTGSLKSQVTASTDSRAIYAFSGSAGNKLRSFTWGNLSATEQGYFATSALSQYSTWSASERSTATGDTLVNYIRGQTGYENQTGAIAALYRDRVKTLGDVVGSQPVYVKKPYFSYSDAGYTDYITSQSNRAATVFIGVNDGMLHAFDASNGNERWAYIPTPVLPTLYKLADANYASLHSYYADGSLSVADICTANCTSATASWKTILVGGLNAGGRGYYALDITDPTSPSALWELTTAVDSDIGYSFGNPIVTKDDSGRWVVLLSAGYNNVSPGSGNGILFVIDAYTGSIIRKVNTGTGSTASPAGLARLAGWSSDPVSNNQASFLYGGDLDGNLWRFDFNAGSAVKIAALTSSGGTAQPISSRPELADIAGTRMVYVATGKLLENADLSSTQSQTIYGIKDVYDSSGTLSAPHSSLIQQTLTNGTNSAGAAIRTGSSNAVNLSSDRGWYIDLPDSGERSNIDMQLVSGSLLVPTNVPSTSVCYSAGYGWLNYLDYKTGGYQSNATNGYAGTKAGNALIVGMVVMKLPTGFVVNATLSDNPTPVKMTNISVGGASTGLVGKRTSWRELP